MVRLLHLKASPALKGITIQYTNLEIFRSDFSLNMLCLKLRQLSIQSCRVVEKSNADVDSAQHTLRVSCEFGWVDVFSVDAGEKFLGVGHGFVHAAMR